MGRTVQNSLVNNLIVRYKFSSGNWKKSRLSLHMAKEFLLIFVGKINNQPRDQCMIAT